MIRHLLFFAAAASASIADEGPLRLQVLEAQFEADLRARETALEKKYREALTKLIPPLKAAGDLEGILSVEGELETFAARDSEAEKAPPIVFRLPAHRGAPTGRVRFDADDSLLVSWRESGGASFSLAGLPAGRYRISMDYYAGPFAGGKLRVAVPTSNQLVDIAGGRSWKELKTAALGEFQLLDEDQVLSIRIVQARAIGVMELAAISIEPLPPSR